MDLDFVGVLEDCDCCHDIQYSKQTHEFHELLSIVDKLKGYEQRRKAKLQKHVA